MSELETLYPDFPLILWDTSKMCMVSETQEPSNSLCDKTVHFFSVPATSGLTQILMYRLTYQFHILILLLFWRLIFLGQLIIFKISSNIPEFIHFFQVGKPLVFMFSGTGLWTGPVSFEPVQVSGFWPSNPYTNIIWFANCITENKTTTEWKQKWKLEDYE